MLININMDQLSGSSGIRGENTIEALDNHARAETSPHTRGEPYSNLKIKVISGNIPAYAGRTTVTRRLFFTCGKHPRIRGENMPSSKAAVKELETSPHTRGEP